MDRQHIQSQRKVRDEIADDLKKPIPREQLSVESLNEVLIESSLCFSSLLLCLCCSLRLPGPSQQERCFQWPIPNRTFIFRSHTTTQSFDTMRRGSAL